MTELERIIVELQTLFDRLDADMADDPTSVDAARAKVMRPLVDEAIDLLVRAIYRAERVA